MKRRLGAALIAGLIAFGGVLFTAQRAEALSICAIYNDSQWEWYWFLCYLN